MEDNGKISVIMGIFNCGSTLGEAIESIQNQTYTNWELILCDDGSKDNTFEVANKYAESDKRIILLKNEKNLGLNATLNHCLKYVTGEYIARMDGDDISLTNRFETQLNFLKSHPKYQIVSCPMILFDENGEWGITKIIPEPTVEEVVCKSVIHHAPVMMKAECMEKVHGYTEDPRMIRVEDVNLWIKLYTAGYRCFNLDTPLYCMRNDQNAVNRRKYKYRINSTYVRLLGCRDLKLDWKCYIKSFKPMVIGLVPARIRQAIRKRDWSK